MVNNMVNSFSKEVLEMMNTADHDATEIFCKANILRKKHKGNLIELCAIVNAKSGRCSEDCSFCAQSSKYKTNINIYPLLHKDEIIKKAVEATQNMVKRFSIVISGKKPSKKELLQIGNTIEELAKRGINICASLGLLELQEISYLKNCGLQRLHCNIETSEKFFPKICRTHSFKDKVKTLESAKKAGVSICSGGVFGLGESWIDRVEMAYFLKEMDVDSVPINFLTPIKGTPLENQPPLSAIEALKIVSLFRFVLPEKDIRICGGRPLLGDFASWVFFAGANALMTGNYLTTTGRSFQDDLNLIKNHGLEVDSVVS